MWKHFGCYLSGRHEFGVWCEPGAIFLRCVHCGKRSSGWSIDAKAGDGKSRIAPAVVTDAGVEHSRVLPFSRAAAR